MPTRGEARTQTIRALQNQATFQRSGFGMWASDKREGTGVLPERFIPDYKGDRDSGNIVYTVMSYATPIAWVLADGRKIIPDVKYSVTTTNHQALCRQYL